MPSSERNLVDRWLSLSIVDLKENKLFASIVLPEIILWSVSFYTPVDFEGICSYGTGIPL